MRLLNQFASRKSGCDDDAGAFGARTRRHRRIRLNCSQKLASTSVLHGTIVTLLLSTSPRQISETCYTGVTLNTSVVWCDYSGAAFDLRIPAFSFPSVRLQRNQNIRLAIQVAARARN